MSFEGSTSLISNSVIHSFILFCSKPCSNHTQQQSHWAGEYGDKAPTTAHDWSTTVLVLHTHTHTRLTALIPGLPGWAGTRKVKPIWILLKQETVSSSGISWAICKSASRSRQTTTPAPHHSSFLEAGCPSCRPTNSVKALKALKFCQSWKFDEDQPARFRDSWSDRNS